MTLLELRFEFPNRSFRVTWEASQGGQDAGLRPCPFKYHGVVNLDFVEMIEFGLEELTALVDGCVDQRVAVVREWHLWPIGLEEVLVDVESRPE